MRRLKVSCAEPGPYQNHNGRWPVAVETNRGRHLLEFDKASALLLLEQLAGLVTKNSWARRGSSDCTIPCLELHTVVQNNADTVLYAELAGGGGEIAFRLPRAFTPRFVGIILEQVADRAHESWAKSVVQNMRPWADALFVGHLAGHIRLRCSQVVEDFDMDHKLGFTDAVANITAAYLQTHEVKRENLPRLIESVSLVLGKTVGGPQPALTQPTDQERADASITDEGLISFIDGKTYKSLKRHLVANGHTPETYRSHFGLPPDYPMVSAAYSAKRSALAKASHLGKRRPPDYPAATEAPPRPRLRTRPTT